MSYCTTGPARGTGPTHTHAVTCTTSYDKGHVHTLGGVGGACCGGCARGAACSSHSAVGGLLDAIPDGFKGVVGVAAIAAAVWFFKYRENPSPRFYVESYSRGSRVSRLGPFKTEGRARAQMTKERRMGLQPKLVRSRRKQRTLHDWHARK